MSPWNCTYFGALSVADWLPYTSSRTHFAPLIFSLMTDDLYNMMNTFVFWKVRAINRQNNIHLSLGFARRRRWYRELTSFFMSRVCVSYFDGHSKIEWTQRVFVDNVSCCGKHKVQGLLHAHPAAEFCHFANRILFLKSQNSTQWGVMFAIMIRFCGVGHICTT